MNEAEYERFIEMKAAFFRCSFCEKEYNLIEDDKLPMLCLRCQTTKCHHCASKEACHSKTPDENKKSDEPSVIVHPSLIHQLSQFCDSCKNCKCKNCAMEPNHYECSNLCHPWFCRECAVKCHSSQICELGLLDNIPVIIQKPVRQSDRSNKYGSRAYLSINNNCTKLIIGAGTIADRSSSFSSSANSILIYDLGNNNNNNNHNTFKILLNLDEGDYPKTVKFIPKNRSDHILVGTKRGKLLKYIKTTNFNYQKITLYNDESAEDVTDIAIDGDTGSFFYIYRSNHIYYYAKHSKPKIIEINPEIFQSEEDRWPSCIAIANKKFYVLYTDKILIFIINDSNLVFEKKIDFKTPKVMSQLHIDHIGKGAIICAYTHILYLNLETNDKPAIPVELFSASNDFVFTGMEINFHDRLLYVLESPKTTGISAQIITYSWK